MSTPGFHMSGSGAAAHREAQEALPWLANGRLAGAELERVQAHLKTCAQCRSELAALHTLRAAAPAHASAADADLDPGLDVERALARLLPQLDAPLSRASDEAVSAAPAPALPASGPPRAPVDAEALPARHGWRARLAANDARWLRVAVALQCCAIAVLAGLLAQPSDAVLARNGDYRVLGAEPGAQGRVIVTFKPDTPERELRRIVQASGAQLAGGPTATGAWLLGTEDAPAAVAARLRAEPAVTLAEPLGMEPQR